MQKKYEVLCIVGEGAYGIVYKCRNKETNEIVAIKKFKETDDDLVKKTMKRELHVLQILKHENIVEFKEAFTRKGNLFLVFEFVPKTLLDLLEESPTGLDHQLIKNLIYQLCKAVKYLHDQNIIHRDVKPENLLIKDNKIIKLCDFGFARKIQNKQNETLTDYVATRWYRSPELLITSGKYGPEVDYWAIGCIMGELADGNPLFPGENETDQLHCIQKVLGNLPEDQVEMFYKNPIYNGKKLLDITKPETLEKRYMGKLPKVAIKFMKGLLELNPRKRLCGDKVFQHQYFASFADNNNSYNNTSQTSTYNLFRHQTSSSSQSNREDKNYLLTKHPSDNNIFNGVQKNSNATINTSQTNDYSDKDRGIKEVYSNNNSSNNLLISNNSGSQKLINTTNINIINFNNFKNDDKSPNKILAYKNSILSNIKNNNQDKKINSMALTMTNKFPVSLQNTFKQNNIVSFPRKSFDLKSESEYKEYNSSSSFNFNNNTTSNNNNAGTNNNNINKLYNYLPQNSNLMGYKTFFKNKNDNIYNYNINTNFNGTNSYLKQIIKKKNSSNKSPIIEEVDEEEYQLNTKKSKSLNQKNKPLYNNYNNINISNLYNNINNSPMKEKTKYGNMYKNNNNQYYYKNNNNNNNYKNNKGFYGGAVHINMPNISCYNGGFIDKNYGGNNLNNGCYLPSLKNNNINSLYIGNYKKYH